MSENDIRWKQRFSNFERSLRFLEDALKIQDPDIVQKAGLIQFFEIGFELSVESVERLSARTGAF